MLQPTTNTYVLTGSGTNMWLKSDEFFMNWKKETGDFSLSAKVGFVGDGVDPHRKLALSSANPWTPIPVMPISVSMETA